MSTPTLCIRPLTDSRVLRLLARCLAFLGYALYDHACAARRVFGTLTAAISRLPNRLDRVAEQSRSRRAIQHPWRCQQSLTNRMIGEQKPAPGQAMAPNSWLVAQPCKADATNCDLLHEGGQIVARCFLLGRVSNCREGLGAPRHGRCADQLWHSLSLRRFRFPGTRAGTHTHTSMTDLHCNCAHSVPLRAVNRPKRAIPPRLWSGALVGALVHESSNLFRRVGG